MSLGSILGKQGSGGGTLSKIFESVKSTATGVGQQVTGSAAREEAIEANRQRVRQVSLLEKIEENTREGDGAGGGDDDKEEQKSRGLVGAIMGLFGAIGAFSIAGFVKGLFSKMFSFMGEALMTGLKSIGGWIMKGLGFVGRYALRGIMAGLRAVFNPKNLLRFVTRIFPLAALFGALANGIWEAFDTFMSGGSIGEVIGGFLGGVLEFLSFGLLDAEMIKTAFVDAIGMFDEYIIQPLVNFFGDLGTTISGYWTDYIATPISDAFIYIGGVFSGVWETISGYVDTIGGLMNDYIISPISDLFNTYIVEPLKAVIEPIAGFLERMMNRVVSFLEDFGIPAIGFDIPLYGPVEFGPWYPFRTEGSDTGTTAVTAGDTVETTSTTNAEGETTETTDQLGYIKTVGSITDMDGSYTEDETRILVDGYRGQETTDADGNTVASASEESIMLNFDANTGVATVNDEVVDKSVFRAGKNAAAEGGDVQMVQDAIDQQKAYLELSWWRKARALSGSDPRDLLAQQMGDDRDLDIISADRMERAVGAALTGEAVDQSSDQVADAAAQSGNNTVVISAPSTNVSNNASNNNVAIAPPIRNQESTISRYQAGSYGY